MKTKVECLRSTEDVARELGITYRQLDHWIRVGTVVPTFPTNLGSGHPRQWTEDDVRRLRIVVERYARAREDVELFRRGDLWRATAA